MPIRTRITELLSKLYFPDIRQPFETRTGRYPGFVFSPPEHIGGMSIPINPRIVLPGLDDTEIADKLSEVWKNKKGTIFINYRNLEDRPVWRHEIGHQLYSDSDLTKRDKEDIINKVHPEIKKNIENYSTYAIMRRLFPINTMASEGLAYSLDFPNIKAFQPAIQEFQDKLKDDELRKGLGRLIQRSK